MALNKESILESAAKAIERGYAVNITGKCLFRRHCGTRMLRLEVIELFDSGDGSGSASLSSRDNYAYCSKCGELRYVSGPPGLEGTTC